MEIERKFLIKIIPENLNQYQCIKIEQAYLCTDPVVRIRQQDEEYFLTYKSKGLMVREEVNLPLTSESYLHLKQKVDGKVISKRRYLIPLETGETAELDLFDAPFEPLQMAEVEFESEEAAYAFIKPAWFAREVTHDFHYHNSYLSKSQSPFNKRNN